MTDLVRRSVTSWRQLPFNLYQIRTKFRDEIRPRFGLLRGREFLMKDAYSFDVDQKGLDVHYVKMETAYRRIFERCGLEYALVQADSGAIGGSASEEFMVVADTGEDALVFSEDGRVRREHREGGHRAPRRAVGGRGGRSRSARPTRRRRGSSPARTRRATSGRRSTRITKTMLYEAVRDDGTAFVVRGPDPRRPRRQRGEAPEGARRRPREARRRGEAPRDRRLPSRLRRSRSASSRRRAGRGPDLRRPFDGERPQRLLRREPRGAPPFELLGEARPEGRGRRRGGDRPRRRPLADRGTGVLRIKRGIEVGHIFKLGTKYSEAMKCEVADPAQKMVPLSWGATASASAGRSRRPSSRTTTTTGSSGRCRSRRTMRPPLASSATRRSSRPRTALRRPPAAGVEVFYDDRDERPGVKFKDADLVGFPVRSRRRRQGAGEGRASRSRRGARRRPKGSRRAKVVEVVKATLAAGARTLAGPRDRPLPPGSNSLSSRVANAGAAATRFPKEPCT